MHKKQYKQKLRYNFFISYSIFTKKNMIIIYSYENATYYCEIELIKLYQKKSYQSLITPTSIDHPMQLLSYNLNQLKVSQNITQNSSKNIVDLSFIKSQNKDNQIQQQYEQILSKDRQYKLNTSKDIQIEAQQKNRVSSEQLQQLSNSSLLQIIQNDIDRYIDTGMQLLQNYTIIVNQLQLQSINQEHSQVLQTFQHVQLQKDSTNITDMIKVDQYNQKDYILNDCESSEIMDDNNEENYQQEYDIQNIQAIQKTSLNIKQKKSSQSINYNINPTQYPDNFSQLPQSHSLINNHSHYINHKMAQNNPTIRKCNKKIDKRYYLKLKNIIDERRHYISQFVESFRRKSKISLSGQQIQNLQYDFNKTNISKENMQLKYGVSSSTLNRYIRLLKSFADNYSHRTNKSPPLIPDRSIFNKMAQLKELDEQIQRKQRKQMKQVKQSKQRKCQPQVNRLNKIRLVQQKVGQIFKKYPSIYKKQVAQILTKHFEVPISIHIVSQCLKNIQFRKQLQQNPIATLNEPNKNGDYASLHLNSKRNIYFRFKFSQQFLSINQKNIIFIDQMIFRSDPAINNSCYIDRINFLFAVGSNGKIVHWKIKNQSFKPEEIAKFLQEIAKAFYGYTIILDSARIHKDQIVKNTIQNNLINVLYQPPYSQYFNPVQNIFNIFAEIFQKRIKAGLDLQGTLRLANNKIFTKQIQTAKQYIQLAAQKQPLPIDKSI